MSKKTVTFVYGFLVRTPVEVEVKYSKDNSGDVGDFEIVSYRTVNVDRLSVNQLHDALSYVGDCEGFVDELVDAIERQESVS